MTRKHYEKAAEIAANMPYPNENVIEAFTIFFQNDNPRFDKDRFYQAATGETGPRGGKK